MKNVNRWANPHIVDSLIHRVTSVLSGDRTGICSLALVLLLLSCSGVRLLAQSDNASLTGSVQDPAKAYIPDVRVLAINTDTNQRFAASTNREGRYSLASLPVGPYRIEVEKPGFQKLVRESLFLHTQDALQINFQMAVGSTGETITVSADSNNINTTDAAVGTVIDHQFVDEIPMNGRSFQSLVLLSPGVVTNNPNGTSLGEYSVNGMRADSNGFSVDGASASNAPSFASTSGSSGMLPSSTVLGTTQAMLMIDALEEFRIATSTYSAEFGSHPGAQISFRSRSGTNSYHGTLFDYLRNSAFDANNWFNTYSTTPVPTPAERQNDFGGTIGGPLSIPHLYSGRDRTFFFFAYEGLRLTEPQASTIYYVPSNGTFNTGTYSNTKYKNLRANAPVALQPFLNAWPLPNCSTAIDPQCVDYGDGGSPYISTPTSSGSINALSARIDYQLLPSMRVFARYTDTISSTDNVGSTSTPGPYQQALSGRNRVFLLGSDNTFGASLSNEVRLQYSPASFVTHASPALVGGAAPYNLYTAQGIQPGGETYVRLYLPNEASIYQEDYGTLQFQPNATEALTWAHGKHLFKFGGSYVQTTSYFEYGNLSRSPLLDYHFTSASSILSNVPGTQQVQVFTRQDPTYKQLGLFAQDEWRLLPKLSLSLGLRWELAPPPSISGSQTYTYTGSVHDPGSLGLSAPGAPLYQTDYKDFAPRFGMAYTIHDQPGHELVFRAGVGLFYETIAINNFFGDGVALGAARTVSYKGNPFPLTQSQINLPVLPPVAPYTFVDYPDTSIVPPYALQWNASLEQALGSRQTITLGYVASGGRKLTTFKLYSLSGLTNKQFTNFQLYANGPGSSYNSLQLKYQRQMSHGLQVLSSYTWAHSIDWSSSDNYTATFPIQSGNSDHDIRHNLTAAMVYNVPASYQNRLAKAVLGYWNADLWFVARTAFPYEPEGPEVTDPITGEQVYGELNYNGKNPYVHVAGIPGGRQIDPTVFSVTSTPLGVGTAPRNFLRGFGEAQANVAIQRSFPLFERSSLQFRAEAFNLTNHPNFGAINATCGATAAGAVCNNTLMGQATNTLSTGLGNLNSLYQQGGPRSLEFALKLLF